MNSPSSTWLTRAGECRDNDPFLITDRATVTYGELRDTIARTTGWLDSLGVAPDSRVAVCTHDPVAMSTLAVSLFLAGRCLVPLDPDGTSAELLPLLERVEPQLLLADQPVLDRLVSPTADHVVSISSAPTRTVADRLLRRRRKPQHAAESAEVPPAWPAVLGSAPPAALPDLDAESIALVMFTGGSSGQPKGVLLSHRAIEAHLEALRVALDHDRSVIHNVLPMHHIDGLVQGPIMAFAYGGTLVRPQPFSVGALPALLDAIYTHRVTHLITVPTMLALIDRLGGDYLDAFAGDHFQLIMSNAAPLADSLWARVEDRFGVVVCNSYGLTETVTSTLLSGTDEARHRSPGTVGRVIDGHVDLLDEHGHIIEAPDTAGEVVIRGDHLFSGYLDAPELTAEVFDGITLHTGDLATRDAEGHYRVVGRRSRMIISGGENVAPDAIDAVMQQHDAVVESITVGLDDAVWGQRVVTAVVADRPVDAAELLEHCRQSLSGMRVPREISIMNELPRTSAGKIDPLAVVSSMAMAKVEGDSIPAIVQSLAAAVFGVSTGTISSSAPPSDQAGWDSLAHMELVSRVEMQWDIAMSNTDVIGIGSLDDLVDCVQRHIS